MNNHGCQYHGYHEPTCSMCRAIAADRQLRSNPVQVDRDWEEMTVTEQYDCGAHDECPDVEANCCECSCHSR